MGYNCVLLFILVAVSFLIIYYWRQRIKAHHAIQVQDEKSKREEAMREEAIKEEAIKEEARREEARREEAKRVLGRIVHELGTPISEMSISLHALHKDLPGKFSHHLFAIENAVERVKAIMQAMCEIQRFEGSIKSDLDINSSSVLKVVSVNKLLQTAIMAVKETRDEDVKFLIQYSSETDISCNPNEIIQVFINLLKNSYDAVLPDIRGERKGKVIVESIKIREIVQVTIEDNGEGISEDKKNLIFKEGFTTREGEGRGFGLAIAKDLVEKNNGNLDIKSKIVDGKISGCIATVEFPKSC